MICRASVACVLSSSLMFFSTSSAWLVSRSLLACAATGGRARSAHCSASRRHEARARGQIARRVRSCLELLELFFASRDRFAKLLHQLRLRLVHKAASAKPRWVNAPPATRALARGPNVRTLCRRPCTCCTSQEAAPAQPASGCSAAAPGHAIALARPPARRRRRARRLRVRTLQCGRCRASRSDSGRLRCGAAHGALPRQRARACFSLLLVSMYVFCSSRNCAVASLSAMLRAACARRALRRKRADQVTPRTAALHTGGLLTNRADKRASTRLRTAR